MVTLQRHRSSRTQRFAAQFAKAREDAEVLIVTGIYSAGDEPIEGITGRTIFDLIPPADHRFYCESQDECLGRLQEILKPGDTVLTLGAGSIYRVGEKLLDRLR
jgi:UDP-N-acetylmuramate--alanine ligase